MLWIHARGIGSVGQKGSRSELNQTHRHITWDRVPGVPEETERDSTILSKILAP